MREARSAELCEQTVGLRASLFWWTRLQAEDQVAKGISRLCHTEVSKAQASPVMRSEGALRAAGNCGTGVFSDISVKWWTIQDLNL